MSMMLSRQASTGVMSTQNMGIRFAVTGRDEMDRTLREIQPPSESAYDFYRRQRTPSEVYVTNNSHVGYFGNEPTAPMIGRFVDACHGYTGMPLERKLPKVPPVELHAKNFTPNEVLFEEHRRLGKPVVVPPYASYRPTGLRNSPLNHRAPVRTSSASALLTAAGNFMKIKKTPTAGVGTLTPVEVLKQNKSNLWSM